MANKVVKKNTPPKAGAGRPKGSLNKTTMACKEAISYAFDGLGGADGLIAWAKADEKNLSAFWTSIYPKLLPLQVTGEGGGAIHIIASSVDQSL